MIEPAKATIFLACKLQRIYFVKTWSPQAHFVYSLLLLVRIAFFAAPVWTAVIPGETVAQDESIRSRLETEEVRFQNFLDEISNQLVELQQNQDALSNPSEFARNVTLMSTLILGPFTGVCLLLTCLSGNPGTAVILGLGVTGVGTLARTIMGRPDIRDLARVNGPLTRFNRGYFSIEYQINQSIKSYEGGEIGLNLLLAELQRLNSDLDETHRTNLAELEHTHNRTIKNARGVDVEQEFIELGIRIRFLNVQKLLTESLHKFTQQARERYFANNHLTEETHRCLQHLARVSLSRHIP